MGFRGSSKSPEKVGKKKLVRIEGESDVIDQEETIEGFEWNLPLFFLLFSVAEEAEVTEEYEEEEAEDYEEAEDEESGLAHGTNTEGDGNGVPGETEVPVKKKRGRPLGFRPSARKVKQKKVGILFWFLVLSN